MRAVIVALACLVLSPAANAACPVRTSDARGPAPLRVTFTATCPSSVYRWRFGDGAEAAGRRVAHVFLNGRYPPTLLTDRGRQLLDAVTAVALTVVAPRRASYGEPVTFRARVVPKLPVRIAGKALRGGELTVPATHPAWTVVAGGVALRRTIRIRPRLDIRLAGRRTVGSPLRVAAVLRPAHAGELTVEVDGLATEHVDTASVRAARIVVVSKPRGHWLPVARVVHAHIRAPSLELGDRGPSVGALEQRLEELRFAIDGRDEVYGEDDMQAVLAFKEVYGLEQMGEVRDPLEAAYRGPRAGGYGSDHVEVDKPRQVLFLVRDGKVVLVTRLRRRDGKHAGRRLACLPQGCRVERVLWYPSYFLRGFAIHGPRCPRVPGPSHGCVRVPMWLAPRLAAQSRSTARSTYTRGAMGDSAASGASTGPDGGHFGPLRETTTRRARRLPRCPPRRSPRPRHPGRGSA